MLDVDSFMNDEKLRCCSPASVGIYIRLLCVLHKSDTYGAILYQQKDLQKAKICGYKNPNKIQIFVAMLSRQLPETREEIEAALTELFEEGVIQIYDNRLEQKRMVRDAEISEKRQQARSQRGKAHGSQAAETQEETEFCTYKTANKNQNFVPTKPATKFENLLDTCAPAKCVYNNIQENITQEEDTDTKGKGVQGENYQKNDGSTVPMSKVMGFIALWEQKCPNLPTVRKMTAKRREKIRARLRDEPDLSVWAEVFTKISASGFCNGTLSGGWRASFDWITANAENYVKVLEGNYDRTSKQQGAGAAGPSGAAPEIDWSAEERL